MFRQSSYIILEYKYSKSQEKSFTFSFSTIFKVSCNNCCESWIKEGIILTNGCSNKSIKRHKLEVEWDLQFIIGLYYRFKIYLYVI